MEVKQYQTIIEKTAVYPKTIGIAYCALGLTGEAGEVAEKIKKFYRDGVYAEGSNLPSLELNRDKVDGLKKELGDVLWYITALANELGWSLEEIMEINYNKLIKRRETDTLHGSGDDREDIK